MTQPTATFINRGAILKSFHVGPGGRNIVVNFNTPQEYRDNPAFFGANIGRVANRLKNAQIDDLNGQIWLLEANLPPNSIHGGTRGWALRDWAGPTTTSDGKTVYTYHSPHLEEGFPGAVDVSITYRSYEEPSGELGITNTCLEIEYKAELVGDEVEETIVNITNHSYFILADLPTIDGTRVVLSTSQHLLTDDTGVPNNIIPVPYPGVTAGTPFTLGATEPNFDHCFILNEDVPSIPIDTRSLPLKSCARFYHPTTKVAFEVLTTDPAFQFYTGQYVSTEPRGDGSPARGSRAGFCIEPGRYVNAGNQPEWKSMTVVKKGKPYGAKIVYKTSKGGHGF